MDVGSVSPGAHAAGEHGLVGLHRKRSVRYRHIEDVHEIHVRAVLTGNQRAAHHSDGTQQLIDGNTGREVQARADSRDDDGIHIERVILRTDIVDGLICKSKCQVKTCSEYHSFS